MLLRLIKAGADIRSANSEGRTPLHCCVSHCTAAKRATLRRLLATLLKAGAEVNSCGKDGTTLLHELAAVGQSEEVKLLLQHQADVNWTNEKGRMALHFGRVFLSRKKRRKGLITKCSCSRPTYECSRRTCR